MRFFRIAIALILVSVVEPNSVDAQSRQPSTEPARLRATIDLNIGDTDESRDAYIFGVIDGLALDAQGRIIVADRKDHTVRVFDGNGRHLYTVGRKGRGPGDLDSPCCLTIASDGLLWVKENGNHRYSIFRLGATNASFVRSVRGSSNGVWTRDRVDFDPKGRLIDLASAFDAASKTFRIVRHHVDSMGTVLASDTIPKPPADSLSDVSIRTRNGFASYAQPFGARELHAYGAAGDMAHAVSSRYAVLWVTADGQRRALLERPSTLAPNLSVKEREWAEELLSGIARSTAVPRANLPLRIPNQKAPLQALGFDLDGRLWIERSVADGQPGEADVYDRNGQWIAIMQWPSEVKMHFWTVRGRTGVGVAEDEDGGQRVVRVQFR